jgi:hypothetical protein
MMQTAASISIVTGKLTVALLMIVPLGAIICGGDTQDRSAISRHFSHQILTQGVQGYGTHVHMPSIHSVLFWSSSLFAWSNALKVARVSVHFVRLLSGRADVLKLRFLFALRQ